MGNVFKAVGQPEDWLQNLEVSVKRTLRTAVVKAYETSTMWSSGEVKREEWLVSTCAQVALLVMRLRFVEDAESKMDAMDSGDEDALRSYLTVCGERLQKIIDLYRGKKDEEDKKVAEESKESTELTFERRGLIGDAIVRSLSLYRCNCYFVNTHTYKNRYSIYASEISWKNSSTENAKAHKISCGNRSYECTFNQRHSV